MGAKIFRRMKLYLTILRRISSIPLEHDAALINNQLPRGRVAVMKKATSYVF